VPAVMFRGESINTAESIPPWALVEFGAVASDDVEVSSPRGMKTLFDLFEVLVVSEDWERFRSVAKRASEDEFIAFITDAAKGLKPAKSGRSTSASNPVDLFPPAG
jgi:hypothetical protein